MSTNRLFICFLLLNIASHSSAYSAPSPKNYKEAVDQYFGFRSSSKTIMLDLKGYQQTEDYTCAPASAMSLMRYYGMLTDQQMTRGTEMKIAREMGTNNHTGTSPTQFVNWLQTHGFKVSYHQNGDIKTLYGNLKKGIPTIVEWIDWGGHWEVVTGYNQTNKQRNTDLDTILFADPSAHLQYPQKPFINGITSFNASRFNSMWFDVQYFYPGHLVRGIYIVAVPKRPTV